MISLIDKDNKESIYLEFLNICNPEDLFDDFFVENLKEVFFEDIKKEFNIVDYFIPIPG